MGEAGTVKIRVVPVIDKTHTALREIGAAYGDLAKAFADAADRIDVIIAAQTTRTVEDVLGGKQEVVLSASDA
jgi:hypothetical protein